MPVLRTSSASAPGAAAVAPEAGAADSLGWERAERSVLLGVSYCFYSLGDRWNARLRQGFTEDRTLQEAQVRAEAARQATAEIMVRLNQALAAARVEGWEVDGPVAYPPGVPRTEVEPPAEAEADNLDDLYPPPVVYRVTYDSALLRLRRPAQRG